MLNKINKKMQFAIDELGKLYKHTDKNLNWRFYSRFEGLIEEFKDIRNEIIDIKNTENPKEENIDLDSIFNSIEDWRKNIVKITKKEIENYYNTSHQDICYASKENRDKLGILIIEKIKNLKETNEVEIAIKKLANCTLSHWNNSNDCKTAELVHLVFEKTKYILDFIHCFKNWNDDLGEPYFFIYNWLLGDSNWANMTYLKNKMVK
jgi:hypothetical protein